MSFAAQYALDAHKNAARLEPDLGDETDLWHLLHDLLEWCDEKSIDFDAVLSDVRADFNA